MMERKYMVQIVALRHGREVVLGQYRGSTEGLSDIQVKIIDYSSIQKGGKA